jgi:hypothetical protein
MTWLIWRQSRLELLIGGIALGLVSIWLIWTGLNMASAYSDLGLGACISAETPDNTCQFAVGDFMQRFNTFQGIKIVPPLCLPFLIGLLLAAPTVLDFEQGTYRLAWTQGVTRRRWLATRIGIGLAASVVVSIGLVALMMWWRAPLDRINGRFDGGAFDFEGTVPIAYTIFAFSLCLAAGTILRRSIPALGIGFAAFLGVRALVAAQIRPHYLEPKTVTWSPNDPVPAAVASQGVANRDWIIRDTYVDFTGNLVNGNNAAIRECMSGAVGSGKISIDANTCLAQNGVMNSVVYHPASRFMLFQGIETALFLGLAAILLGVTIWWVMRRIV